VLQLRRVDSRAEEGRVRLRQTAIGVNYIDVVRTGAYA
jgi:hypothetical protein